MQLDCTSIVLSARRYGEGALIAHVFTREMGRVAVYVPGGGSRRQAATWQVGSLINCRYTSRLPDQLALGHGETLLETAAYLLDRPICLALLNALSALIDSIMPEGEPRPDFHAETVSALVALTRSPTPDATVSFLKWECALLAEAGFGLDLTSCAVTGGTEGLIYVSPKSGMAVSADAAGAWQARLLRLPQFLRPAENATSVEIPSAEAIRDGARLTHYFLAHHVFGARHLPIPAARQLLQDRLETAAQRLDEAQNKPFD